MSPAERARAALAADPDFVALVGTRLFPQVMPQNTTMPAVVLLVVGGDPQHALYADPARVLVRSRVQVDCYGESYKAAYQVADAVTLFLEARPGPELVAYELGRRDFYENETKLHRVSVDFDLWCGR